MKVEIIKTECPCCNKRALTISAFERSLILDCLNCPPGAILAHLQPISHQVANEYNVIQGPWQNPGGLNA